jgi:hypothetical protein
MYSDRDIARLLSEACHARWPGRHIAGPAEKFGWSKASVANWHTARRRMPAKKMADFATSLRETADVLNGLAGGIAEAAEQLRLRGRRPRGFQKVQDWDGTGIECDRRWRGGRGKKRGTA